MMGLESASYISQLDPLWPLGGDTTDKGDDHLRLIKSVLQTQFPNLGAAAANMTAAELNLLVGLLASASELNILDGATVSTSELNLLVGLTAAAAELNILDGALLTTAQLNILNGAVLSTAELNFVAGVTSAIQTQLDGKSGTGHTHTGSSISDLDAGDVTTGIFATARIPTILGDKLSPMTAGTEVVSAFLHGDGTVPVPGTNPTYTKVIECRIGQTGTIRVSRTHDAITMFSRIYKNGTGQAAGIGNSAGQHTEDIAVVEGDLIQIYGHCSSDGCQPSDVLSDIWIGVTDGIGIVGNWYLT
jgi:hypothetical protein